MNAEIVAIGTELTLGTTVDTNSAWLAQQLATIGVAVQRITLVGDGIPDITASVRGLGLRKPNQTVTVNDTPENRGMINAATHLLKVEKA